MEIKLRFFAKAKELSGIAETVLQVQQAANLTISSFLNQLFAKYPR